MKIYYYVLNFIEAVWGLVLLDLQSNHQTTALGLMPLVASANATTRSVVA